MPNDRVRLPTSSFDQVKRIIRAYGHHTEPAGLDAVATAAAMNRTHVSGNNAFLTFINVIEGGNRKQLTQLGRDLAIALEHEKEMPEVARDHWRSLVSGNEFLQKVISAVRIRNGMEASNLQAHVAYTAGGQKRPSVMTGARAIVDLLLAAGAISEEDGHFVATQKPSANPPHSKPETAAATHETGRLASLPTGTITGPVDSRQHTQVAISIEISLQCQPDDLDGLGPKIRQLVKDIREKGTEASPPRGA